jgi:pyrimidine deaminase RibD-like protein
MEALDLDFMKEAIDWDARCNPIEASIPKVGAIIAIGKDALGRGRRGTGQMGDGDHAEKHAIDSVADKSKLGNATLYTTLEPCTKEVRSNKLESCAELIHQHQIKRVFVGMLDPNQGVTGKGVWRLQDAGIEVAFFPHELAKSIRALNADFIRSQQTLGATIVSPTQGEELHTYETEGRHPVRFKCLNPPTSRTSLFIYRGGQYWPQPGQCRQIDPDLWEVDGYFGGTGEQSLQIVTATDLGEILIQYYRKVVEHNRSRRERVRGKIDLSLLGGDFPGIEMTGPQKGLRIEASVTVFVASKVNITSASVEPNPISRGQTLKVAYVVECLEDPSQRTWLGASFEDKTGRRFYNTHEDKEVTLVKGTNVCERSFTIAKDAPIGEQMLGVNVWRGVPGDVRSAIIARGNPVPVLISA